MRIRAGPAQVKPRLPQAAVLHREQYSLAAQHQPVRDYDQVMAQFYAGQGHAPARLDQPVANRVKSAASLNGRDRLAQALHALGFRDL